MSPAEVTSFPHRRYGMDHDLYRWVPRPRRPRVVWPTGQPIAAVVVVALEWFPLDMAAGPVKVPGGLERPYPDVGMYSLRDYGTRVGVHRIVDLLDAAGLRATVAVNAAVAERNPWLVREVEDRGWEVLAHGVDMGSPHHAGLAVDEERQLVADSLQRLRRHVAGPVRGWLSPGRSESPHTLQLLAEAGLTYVADWPNDDLPYRMTTPAGPLVALPLSNELDDHTILVELRHSEDDFAQQVVDHVDALRREATPEDGRLLTLTLHPWLTGQPHRVRALRTALAALAAADVWSAVGAEVVAACPPDPDPTDQEPRWTSD